MILPTASGPAARWAVYDYNRKFKDSEPAAGGQAVASIAQVPQDELWMIDLVRVKTSPADLTSTAYVCLDSPDFDVSGTATGAYDVADQNTPLQAPGGSQILIVWKNLADGQRGNVYVQWTVMRATGA